MVDVGRIVDGAAARVKRLYPEDARRARVVTAAVEAMEAFGPAVGLGRIAERAGIPRPHLYRHFASKEQLDAEVVRFGAVDLADRIRPHLAASGTPYDVVVGVIDAAADWATENPQLYRFIAAQGHGGTGPAPEPGPPASASGRERFLSDVRTALVGFLGPTGAAAVPDAVVASVIGFVETGIIWWLDHRDEPLDRVVQRLARHVSVVLADVAAELGLDLSDRVGPTG